MSTNQGQMYEISRGENPDHVVLRALAGNPNRHKPLAQHTPSSTIPEAKKDPAMMYTLDTRYQPIPPKVLPKRQEPQVYYIGSTRPSEQPVSSASFTREEPETPAISSPDHQPIFHSITGQPRNADIDQSPTIFLEPKIISQPILYSVVGAKSYPSVESSNTIDKEIPPPILYSITGRPRRPTVDMSTTSLDIQTPTIDKTPTMDKSPTFYSMLGSPKYNVNMKEPTERSISKQQQLSPSLYSIVGSPSQTTRATQVNIITPSPTPTIQPVKVTPAQPAPVLYALVGNSRVPSNIPKENRPPPPIKQQPNEVLLYKLVGAPSTPQSLPVAPKAEQPNRPVFYSLVGKPNSPPSENLPIRKRPPAQQAALPPATLPLRHVNRNLEQKPPRDISPEEMISYSAIGNQRSPPREPTIPKSQTIFIPLREEERRPRPKPQIQPPTPIDWSPDPSLRKRYVIDQYKPLRVPDYRSPYAYHAPKPYRERKFITQPLPVTNSNRSERQARLPLHEPRYRVERPQPYRPIQPRSVERFPVNAKNDPSLWDYQYQTQTDGEQDTDDERIEPRTFRKQTRYQQRRPRTPWIPVW